MLEVIAFCAIDAAIMAFSLFVALVALVTVTDQWHYRPTKKNDELINVWLGVAYFCFWAFCAFGAVALVLAIIYNFPASITMTFK